MNELVIDEAVPLTGMQETYELTGEYGCLISYPLPDGEEKSRLSYFLQTTFPRWISLSFSIILPYGMNYYLFLPSEYDDDLMDVEFHESGTPDGHVCYKVIFERDSENNYTATLKSVEYS